MIDWWNGRTPRERLLLGVLAAVAAGLAVWYGVIVPLGAWVEAAEARHARAVQTREEVARIAARVEAAGSPAARPPSGVAVRQLVEATAAAGGLELARIEAGGEGEVQVGLEGVQPQALFPWIALLQTEHGVAARHVTVLKAPAGGLTADIVFRGAAG